MASQINYSNLRPLPSDYVLQDADLIAIQQYGSQEPQVINWGRFKNLTGGDSVILTPSLPSTSGAISLIFDKNKVYQDITQTGNINLLLASSGNIVGKTVELTIIGDLSHNLTFPAKWINGNGGSFDNTKLNDIYLEYKNGRVTYTIVNSPIPSAPDLVAPAFVSAATNIAGNKIIITFDKALGGSPNFTIDSNSISSQTIVGSTVEAITGSNIGPSDVIHISGGNTLSNLTSEAFVTPLSNVLVTNNVNLFTNTRSYHSSISNDILRTAVNPTNFQFGSGLTETPYSIVCNVKVTSFGTQQFMFIIGDNATFGFFFCLTNENKLAILLSSLTGSIQAKGGTVLSAGWAQAAVTYSANTRTFADFKIYLNSVAETLTDLSGGSYAGKPAYPPATRLYLGGDPALNPSTGVLIDELYLFNSVLSQSNITNIYNSGVVKDPTTFPVAPIDGWRFENNANSFNGGYNLVSTVAPNYSTDRPL